MVKNTAILIVEDDIDIRQLLIYSLKRAGHNTLACGDANSAWKHLGNHPLPTLAIIDWMLPGLSGHDLVMEIRSDRRTRSLPLIMLTAKGSEADRLQGFSAGVDDYMVKPFSPKELIARIKAVLRRVDQTPSSNPEFDSLKLDIKSHRLYVDRDIIDIGPTEFRLIAFLMHNPERAYTRDELLCNVWEGVFVENRIVDVYIRRLRKVLKPYGLDCRIQTVRGVGYRFSMIS